MSNTPAWLRPLADAVPADKDVVAGWTGFAVFILLCVALALLMWSFSKRLRSTRINFGVDNQGNPIEPAEPIEPAASTDASDDQAGSAVKRS